MTIKNLFFLFLAFLATLDLQAKDTKAQSASPDKKQVESAVKKEKTTKDMNLNEGKKKKPKKEKKVKEKRKRLSEMNYQELKEAKDKKLALKNKESALIFAEKMVPLATDLEELKDLTLELADLYFDLKDLEKAGNLYTEFVKLYPGNDAVEYAQYKAILCNFYAILPADKDQSNTQKTLDLANNFLERRDIFKQYTKDVAAIKLECTQRLAEGEMNVAQFYLKKGSYKSAQARINTITEEFLPKLPDLEPQLLTLEYELATKQGNKELAITKLAQRTEKFPNFINDVKLAQNSKKSNFVNRF